MNEVCYFKKDHVYRVAKETGRVIKNYRYDGNGFFYAVDGKDSFRARITDVQSPRMECALATGYNAFFSKYDEVKEDGTEH